MDWLPPEASTYKVTGAPETREEIAFDVYNNYLTQLVKFINEKYPSIEEYIMFARSSTDTVKENKSFDLNVLRKHLLIGWNTENLVRMNSETEDIDFIRVNNQWKPIQAYYSIYSLAAALSYAITGRPVLNHAQCLRIVSDFIVHIPVLPWNLSYIGYLGNKKVPRTLQPQNFPSVIHIPNSLARTKVTPLEVLACCLQAEHIRRIGAYVKPKEKNATPKYLKEPTPTTLLHFLYRLRMKSNYESAEVFLAEAPDSAVRRFSSNLTKVISFANIYIEVIISRKIGSDNLLSLMGEFKIKVPLASVIHARADMYRNLLV